MRRDPLLGQIWIGTALEEQAAVIGRILRHLGLPADRPVARSPCAPTLLGACEAHVDVYKTAP